MKSLCMREQEEHAVNLNEAVCADEATLLLLPKWKHMGQVKSVIPL